MTRGLPDHTRAMAVSVNIETPDIGKLDVTDKWARELGKADIARVLGAALAHTNPVITRLSDGTSAFIDPRTIGEEAGGTVRRALVDTSRRLIIGDQSVALRQVAAQDNALLAILQRDPLEPYAAEVASIDSTAIAAGAEATVLDVDAKGWAVQTFIIADVANGDKMEGKLYIDSEATASFAYGIDSLASYGLIGEVGSHHTLYRYDTANNRYGLVSRFTLREVNFASHIKFTVKNKHSASVTLGHADIVYVTRP